MTLKHLTSLTIAAFVTLACNPAQEPAQAAPQATADAAAAVPPRPAGQATSPGDNLPTAREIPEPFRGAWAINADNCFEENASGSLLIDPDAPTTISVITLAGSESETIVSGVRIHNDRKIEVVGEEHLAGGVTVPGSTMMELSADQSILTDGETRYHKCQWN